MAVRTLVVAVMLACAAPVAAQPAPLPARPIGALAVLMEVQRLREDNAKLQALLIGRDRDIANLKYELGKQLLEARADLDQARLTTRATDLLPLLRQIFKVEDPAATFDWSQGRFVEKENKR